MLNGKYAELKARLEKTIPTRQLSERELDLLAAGTDASFYQLLPRLIVKIQNEEQLRQVIDQCRNLQIPYTVRAGGTSLSGQALSDSVLLVMEQSHWRKMHLSADRKNITLQPGVIGARANLYLSPHRLKIGPDPASINSAHIGGILANNASGMSSGIRYNIYNTLRDIRVFFSDGSMLDTADEQSRREFSESHAGWMEEISTLHREILADSTSLQRIQKKYSIKNTTGYGLNSLTDFEDPLEIIKHLLVGSEGTLGIVTGLTLDTVPDPPLKATGLIIFPDIAEACRAIPSLRQCRVAAAELMDRASLRSVQDNSAMPEWLSSLTGDATALLVETQADDETILHQQTVEIISALSKHTLLRPAEFTRDLKQIAGLWAVRKGLFPAVCKNRVKGTSVIIEDIAVPYEHLAQAIIEIRTLFGKYGYDNAIIWGHAFDGNIHFVLIQNFEQEQELRNYEGFIGELVRLVVDTYDGSLKAEHGTGRNMAPFVEAEWGSKLYSYMLRLKNMFDPQGLLNPGVLINSDARLHLKHIKPMPAAHDLIDDCIECGFCEQTCVSRELTLTPRQRIVVFREIRHLQTTHHEPHRLAALLDDYNYQGQETCATDGLCALACPVDIDTGKLIKELRAEQATPGAKKLAGFLAGHMAGLTAVLRVLLNIVRIKQKIFGSKTLYAVTSALRKISGNRMPRWTPAMPGGADTLPAPNSMDSAVDVIFFPSCINRSMGKIEGEPEGPGLLETITRLLQKAGYRWKYPENVNQLCCGLAFASKGFKEAGAQKAAELNAALLKATGNGVIPVLCEMSPCLYRMRETLDPRLKLLEPIEFSLNYLLPRLDLEPVQESIVIHTVCSAKKMDLEEKFAELACLCATDVIAPESDCCGFAGDRGFSFPELNEHGLRHLAGQIPDTCRQGYSTSRTCEIGLTEHGGVPYQSILHLLDRISKAKTT